MENNIHNKFKQLGVHIPEIFIPNKNSTDLKKWTVIACDQFTSEPEYWNDLKEFVGLEPSTLKMILPEIYLDEGDIEEKIKLINSTMYNYLNDNIIKNIGNCFIFVQRKISENIIRNGLIVAVDLENYNFKKGSHSLIRATEGTIIERLPPRVKIRENASLEIPHIQMLIDDPSKSVIEPLSKITTQLEKLYDFDIYKNNNIKGFKINSNEILENIFNSLLNLTDKEKFNKKYKLNNKIEDILLFAVGDGNHSLATAKVLWDDIKNTLSDEMKEKHPARYALVELLNIHDESLEFKPIHRIIKKISPEKFIEDFIAFNNKYLNSDTKIHKIDNYNEIEDFINTNKKSKSSHFLPFKYQDSLGILEVINPNHNLEVGTLQNFINSYVVNNPNAKIDYIHGKKVIHKLSDNKNSIGFYLPSMDKNDLFKTVILDGSLPRKTFSMGKATEKRYYLESRLIKLDTVNKLACE
jgi:hypothetical protein